MSQAVQFLAQCTLCLLACAVGCRLMAAGLPESGMGHQRVAWLAGWDDQGGFHQRSPVAGPKQNGPGGATGRSLMPAASTGMGRHDPVAGSTQCIRSAGGNARRAGRAGAGDVGGQSVHGEGHHVGFQVEGRGVVGDGSADLRK
jgi:hypothetical protein